MELRHDFTVPAPVEETWAAFNDLEMVAGCFPGASLTSVEGDDFKGSCKVKLGPIALVYNGTGTFLERDEAVHRFVLEAMGKDKRGNGTAGATVTAVLTAEGPDATRAAVVTDLHITGKPAQFGRGVIQDVSDKLLGQFMDCLESRVRGGEAPAEVSAPSAGEASPEPGEAPVGTPPGSTTPGSTTPLSTTPGSTTPPAPAPPTTERRQEDALDLGATVLPILLKTYWRQLAAAVVVLLVLRRLLGRR